MEPNQLNQLLQFLLDTLQQSKDFTLDQAPLFVKELLWWRFYQAAFYLGWWTVACITAGTYGAKFMSAAMNLNGDDALLCKRLIRIIAIAFFMFSLGINGYTMLQVKVAPRVVLMEAVKGFISGR